MAIRKENIQIFDVAVPPPYVNKKTNTWWLYDFDSGEYVDTSIRAEGKDGADGVGKNLVLNSFEKVSRSNYLVKSYELSQPLDSKSNYTISIKGTFVEGDKPRPHINGIGVEDYATPVIEDGIYKVTFDYDPRFRDVTELEIYRVISDGSSTMTIEWVKLERGSKATDYVEAPEDMLARIARVAADATRSKAITDKFSSNEGGLWSSVVLELHEAEPDENAPMPPTTAGISGVQGTNLQAPAVWVGGTYEDAIAGIANIIFRHDSSGHLAGGMLRWTKDGKLYIGKKGANKLIMLSGETLAELEADTQTAKIVVPDYENSKYANPTQDNPNASASNSYTTVLDLEYDAYVSGVFDIIVGVTQGEAADWGAEGNIELVNTSTNTVMETVWVAQSTDTWEANLTFANRFLPKGKYEIRSSVYAGGTYASGTPSIELFIGHTYIEYTYDVKKLLIGLDGIMVKDSMATNYVKLSLNGTNVIDVQGNVSFKSPNGKNILQVSDLGIRKSTDSGTSWSNL